MKRSTALKECSLNLKERLAPGGSLQPTSSNNGRSTQFGQPTATLLPCQSSLTPEENLARTDAMSGRPGTNTFRPADFFQNNRNTHQSSLTSLPYMEPGVLSLLVLRSFSPCSRHPSQSSFSKFPAWLFVAVPPKPQEKRSVPSANLSTSMAGMAGMYRQLENH